MESAAEKSMADMGDSPFRPIREQIHAAWERDELVGPHSGTLEVVPGDPPALSGEVADVMVKRRAVRLAHQTAPGLTLIDHIHVHADPQVTDGVLTRRALDLISRHRAFLYMSVVEWDPRYSSELTDWIAVAVRNGKVTLHGRVNSLTHRRLAEVLVWRLPGCRDVLNRLHVEPAQQDSDGEITDAAEEALSIVLGPNAGRVNVITRDREVTLTGAVDHERRRRMALEVCWSIPGVHWVYDHVRVR
jgi:hypothetical protein